MIDAAAREEAIGWAIRLRDPASNDWEKFTAWLEVGPDNRNAYDQVMLADADMTEAAGTAQAVQAEARAANDSQPRFFRRYGGIAAALLLIVVARPAYQTIFPTYSIETALGEQRNVTLDDGTIIEMNGGTRLTLDRRDARLAMLDMGEARFRVAHDPQNPFTVQVGDARFQDAGTVFNIAREDEQTEMSVAEGAVLFNPAREAMLLKPGQKLRVARRGATPVVTDVDPAQVGGWQAGRLDFSAETLADVAPDLSRALGHPIDVDPAIASRRFTGTILIDRRNENAIENVAALMGVSVRKADKGWQLTAN
jgi:transmembrane sensor